MQSIATALPRLMFPGAPDWGAAGRQGVDDVGGSVDRSAHTVLTLDRTTGSSAVSTMTRTAIVSCLRRSRLTENSPGPQRREDRHA